MSERFPSKNCKPRVKLFLRLYTGIGTRIPQREKPNENKRIRFHLVKLEPPVLVPPIFSGDNIVGLQTEEAVGKRGLWRRLADLVFTRCHGGAANVVIES